MDYNGLYEIEGLQFVPVNEHKVPMIKNWQTSTDKHNLNIGSGVGLVCGEPSGGVECIDVDEKYSLNKDLFDEYKKSIYRASPTLLNKLVVQKTKNNGYHLVYRCSVNAGNTKLANRPTTPEEREETYDREYKAELLKGTEEAKARKVAEKRRDNDKVRVLIETRGIGGQFVIHPSPGYEFIFGDLMSISEITPEEREVLFSVAMSFNEVFEEPVIVKQKKERGERVSPFEDYNERGDVVELLMEHGWKVISRKGSKTHLLRPGQTTSQTSGNYDASNNWFSVFSTSTEFEPQHAYLPYAVFAVLECNKDFALASKKLYDLGYGDRKKDASAPQPQKPSTREIQSRIDVTANDLSYFATPADYDGYLKSVIDGTLPMGLTTGSPELDKHFLFKEGDFVMVNGIDGVGKTAFVWYLALLSAMYHGFVWTIFSSENTVGMFMRVMVQLYWGKALSSPNPQYPSITPDEYKVAREFVEKHFKIIKAQEQLYNYKDLLNLNRIAMDKFGANHGLIDPYNSLKINLSGFSKLNTHEYHYEAISELKAFGQQNKFSIWINHHAVTAAIRQRDADKKYSVAPRKEDTEGGGKIPNKADSFITVHRITNHPTEWMNVELHIRKIKDTETGGKPTFIDEPVKFTRYKGGYGYCEKLPMGALGLDPVEEWHIQKNGFVSSKKILSQQDMWSPEPMKDSDGNEIDF